MVLSPAKVPPENGENGLADFVDSLPVAVFRESLSGQIVYCNKAFGDLFGFKSCAETVDLSITHLYRNAQDRSSLIEAVIHHGRVRDVLVPFKKRDGATIWCIVTEQAVLDRKGQPVFLDGVLRVITTKAEKKNPRYEGEIKALSDFAALLDPEGNIVEISSPGSSLLGFSPEDLVGKRILDHVVPRFRDLFSTFLSIVAKTGKEEGILTIMDREGEEKHLEFYAFVDERIGMSDHIHLVARNVTERIKLQKEQLSKEKFLGILEMAGGVAHKLNQPLTVIRNTAMEVLSLLSPEDPVYEKIVRIHLQIERIHEMAMKIGNIKRYEAMDYVAGIKIVDIDKTS
jgi:PAS domain S-box-containing protein